MSYLLFADSRANGEDATHFQGILGLYEECSGHVINKEKSVVIFREECSCHASSELNPGSL